MPDGEYLLMKNKVKTEGSKEEKKDLPAFTDQIRQKPNRKTLGSVRLYLRLYNAATNTKDSTKNTTFIRRNLRRIGEPPVLFDSSYAERSSKNITQFLFNHGYYHANTTYEVRYGRKKRVKRVTYTVTPGGYYMMPKEYEVVCDDSLISQILKQNQYNSFLKKQKRVEFTSIALERDRLFNLLRERGYYAFKKDYIDFELDTIHQTKHAIIKLIIDPQREPIANRVFKISSLQVFVNTTTFNKTHQFEIIDSTRYFLSDFSINTQILHKHILLKPHNLYSQKDIDLTYNKLGELGIFDNIEIKFDYNKTDSLLLEAEIILKPGFQKSFTIEPQLISSDLNNQIANVGNYRNYGLANVFTYSNKNLFKGAERLDLSWTTRAETQFRADEQLDRFFTNFQTGLTATLLLPASRMWRGFAARNKINTVRSLITLSYIYENNLDFNRNIIPVAYSYQFIRKNSTFFLTPLEVFYSRSRIEEGFLDKISPRNIEFVKRLFSSNLITSTGLRWNYTAFKKNNPKEYVMFRTNILEVGGNLHRLGRRIMDTNPSQDTTYNFLGVTYFQFIKSEIDFRRSKVINPNSSYAYRGNIGVGVPYGNEDLLPFDKRFFIGGSNSLRGWRPRTLGPGSFRDTAAGTRIDRSGELIIQGSIEYRFKFISPLELGLFMDAGNVWNIVRSEGTVDAEIFKFNRFWNDLALNTGIGFRFDFNFFLFRLDWGIQLRDPEIIANNGWVARQIFKEGWLSNTVLGIGIGYPF